MPAPPSGRRMPPPPPPPPPSVVSRRRPNSSFIRRLTLRQISSRSGGPLLLLRLPHCGSFSDIRVPLGLGACKVRRTRAQGTGRLKSRNAPVCRLVRKREGARQGSVRQQRRGVRRSRRR